ncbi:MAG: RluA family pseudouridine synthase [Nitrospirae bacterium]|nr:RluA family pseudouridine synthase [Nitrospirota bacterium]
MPIVKILRVSPYSDAKRIDQYVTNLLPLSRTTVQKLLKLKLITVNSEPVKANYKIRPDDEIKIEIPGPTPLPLEPEAIPINIVYEDEHLLIVNKPSGMVVHPSPGHYSGTLVHALLHHCKDLKGIGGRERPGIVHRLDKDTSGVLVIAKSDLVHRHLSKQFKDRTVNKVYIALVQGVMKKNRGEIDLPIGRDTKDRKKFSSRTIKPKHAKTLYRVIKRFKNASLLELRPETGRTHQLRVHLAHLNHPVAGDSFYGGRGYSKLGNIMIDRLMLHAMRLGFTHPVTGKYMEFEPPLPDNMKIILERFSGQLSAK